MALTTLLVFNLASAQPNLFPLYSSGGYTGGNGDYTNITNPQLKLSGVLAGAGGYVRVVHLSQEASISAVYNYETGKDAYWGEPTDVGSYIFRGRNLVVEQGSLCIGTRTPTGYLSFPTHGNFITVGRNDWASQMVVGSGWTQTAGDYTELKVPGFSQNNAFLRLQANGSVGIGTIGMSDAGYKLFVETGIRTRKIKVNASVWPDYVFDTGYNLRPLTEIENFIRQYRHLPDVPSETDVKKEGIDLGENQAVLLKKIEELTLYIIEQEKRMDKEHIEMKQLQQQVNDLEKKVNNKQK